MPIAGWTRRKTRLCPTLSCGRLRRPRRRAQADVRFGAHSGLKSDIAPRPKSAMKGPMYHSKRPHYSITSPARARDDRILITKFVPDRGFAGGSPRLVASILCPLPDRQLHKYQPAGPRQARVNHHNLLIVHVARDADRPCRRCRAGLLHLGKR
jgi:hypothetical protein